MAKYKTGSWGILLLFGMVACTSLSEGSGNLPANPDNDRRVQFERGNNAELRRQMNEQSSDINRKRNIEEQGSNSPATTPPMLRPQQLPNAPIDTVHHNVQRPFKTKKRVN
ncbi:hypothetical protein [Pontibacter vulgaris]|uniref:hypothetical protein n=1 Tax=Pontibacter vulgaris TaxID=2905679 RepID=UPI001FA80027|nr:hypothetical protein [Pontibacter vulgaris]